jgi:hypothetical protein
MATSAFFNNYKSKPEQNLVEDLIHEAVKIMGFDCYYLPNSNDQARDLVFSDDPLKKFEAAYPLEVYLSNSVDPGMSGEFFSKFGLEIKNSIRIQMPRRAFAKRVPQDKFQRPREGDLVYIPFLSGTGELYEIKFVNDATDFFTLGRSSPYYWELELELFKYSNDEINTGIEDIDIINEMDAYSIEYIVSSGTGNYTINEIAFQGANVLSSTAKGTVHGWNYPANTLTLTNISGVFSNTETIIGNSSNARYILQTYDPLNYSQKENAWDNKVIETQVDNFIDTSESNPFGGLF